MKRNKIMWNTVVTARKEARAFKTAIKTELSGQKIVIPYDRPYEARKVMTMVIDARDELLGKTTEVISALNNASIDFQCDNSPRVAMDFALQAVEDLQIILDYWCLKTGDNKYFSDVYLQIKAIKDAFTPLKDAFTSLKDLIW